MKNHTEIAEKLNGKSIIRAAGEALRSRANCRIGVDAKACAALFPASWPKPPTRKRWAKRTTTRFSPRTGRRARSS